MISCWKFFFEIQASECAGLGHGQLPSTDFVRLAAPLMKKTRGSFVLPFFVPFISYLPFFVLPFSCVDCYFLIGGVSIVSMLPLIDALHDSPTLRGQRA